MNAANVTGSLSAGIKLTSQKCSGSFEADPSVEECGILKIRTSLRQLAHHSFHESAPGTGTTAGLWPDYTGSEGQEDTHYYRVQEQRGTHTDTHNRIQEQREAHSWKTRPLS